MYCLDSETHLSELCIKKRLHKAGIPSEIAEQYAKTLYEKHINTVHALKDAAENGKLTEFGFEEKYVTIMSQDFKAWSEAVPGAFQKSMMIKPI